MKLKQLFEYKNNFDIGDIVNTALGVGEIVDLVDMGTPNEHAMFKPDKYSQVEYNLDDKAYKMGFSEIYNHVE